MREPARAESKKGFQKHQRTPSKLPGRIELKDHKTLALPLSSDIMSFLKDSTHGESQLTVAQVLFAMCQKRVNDN
jgi:hypothetical protein